MIKPGPFVLTHVMVLLTLGGNILMFLYVILYHVMWDKDDKAILFQKIYLIAKKYTFGVDSYNKDIPLVKWCEGWEVVVVGIEIQWVPSSLHVLMLDRIGSSPESHGRYYKEAMSQIGAGRTRMHCHGHQRKRKCFHHGLSATTPNSKP